MKEFKMWRRPGAIKDITGRTVVGIPAVFGNIDDIADRMHPGSFLKTIAEGRDRVRHLWNHDFGQPPTASIKRLEEVGRDALPAEILAECPEATGGLLVGREYYSGVPLSDWVFGAIQKGDVNEMSFGFDAIRVEWTKEGEGAQEIRIRELREVRLYDTSDVLWGMNSATVANAKSAGVRLEIPLEVLAAQFAFWKSELREGKAGARNAASDLGLIRAIHQATLELGCDTCQGVKDPETDGKGVEAETVEAPGGRDISLSALRRGLDLLNM